MRPPTRLLGTNPQLYAKVSDDYQHKHWREHSRYEITSIFGMQMLHALVAVSCFVFSIAYYIVVWNCGSDCDLYATNTFLSTSVSSENRGWPVLTDSVQQVPPSRANYWPLAPYFGCMQSANMGIDRCNNATVDLYTTCLLSSDPIRTALSSCLSFTGNYYFSWPTSGQFMNCLFSSPVLAPSLNVQNSRKTRNGFRACMGQTPWPFFETVLGPDSYQILGSYNWGLFGVVGLIGLASFSVYSMSTCTSGEVEHGAPGFYQKLGSLWALLALSWNLIFLIVTFSLLLTNTVAISITSGSILILVLSMLSMYFGLELVDGLGGASRMGFSWDSSVAKYKSKYNDRRNERVKRLHEADQKERGGEAVPEYAYSAARVDAHTLALLPEQPDKYQIHAGNVDLYASPLLALWADGYTLCDPLIWLSVAGATGQMTTDYAWNVFTLVGLIRLNNSNIARLLFECFHSDHDLHLDDKDKVVSRATNPVDIYKTSTPGLVLNSDPSNIKAEPYLDLKVLSLSIQLANVLFLISLIYVVYDPHQLTNRGLFNGFVILCFFIPEALRFLVHVYCQVDFRKNHGLFLLLSHQFIWNWDIVFRIIYLGIILLTPNNKDFFGTLGFLKSEKGFVITSGLGYMGI